MAETPEAWRARLGLAQTPDSEFVAALNALEGLESIEGGGLEAAGLVAKETDQTNLWRLGRES